MYSRAGMRRDALPALLAVAGAALVITGAAGRAAVPGPLRIDLTRDIRSIDPALLQTRDEVGQLTALTLYALSPGERATGYRLVPELASKTTISRDRKTYTFTIRKGFRFSNGEGVTAESVTAGIDRTRRLNAVASRFLSDVTGYRVVGPYRVRFQLRRAAPDFLARMTMPFFGAIPKTAPPTPATTPLAGGGPYAIRTWNRGRRFVEVARNPFYRGTRRSLSATIRVNYSVPLDTGWSRCENGQSDVCPVPVGAAAGLAGRYGTNRGRFFVKANTTVSFLALNQARPLFRHNPKLGQALNLALDRPRLLARYGGDLAGSSTSQILPVDFPGYERLTLYRLPDVERAKALAQGNTRGGVARLWIPATFAPIGQIVRESFAPLGLNVAIKAIDPNAYYTEVTQPDAGYDIALFGLGGDYPDPSDFLDVLLYGPRTRQQGSLNVSHLDDPVVNRRLERAARLGGRARLDAYGSLERDVLAGPAPLVPYLNGSSRFLLSERVGCFRFNPWNGVLVGGLCVG